MYSELIKIRLLAYPNVLPSTFFGILEFFQFANQQAEKKWIDLEVIYADKKDLPRGITGTKILENDQIDGIIVPPSMGTPNENVIHQKLLSWLKTSSDKGVLITSACAGSFILAEAGLLDGIQATTHWGLQELFNKKYPEVKLRTDRLICIEGNTITAGGLTSWIDLCIYLCAKYYSVKLAHQMGRFFLVDTGGREQRFYSGFNPDYRHGDDVVLKAQRWIESNYEEPFILKKLVSHLHVSSRTLQRHFKNATQISPIQYIQNLRIQKAKELLEETLETVEQIVWKVGYEDVVTFGKLFKRLTGLSPSSYRKRFRMENVALK